MKKLFLLLVLGITLTACGNSSSTPQAEQTESSSQEVTVSDETSPIQSEPEKEEQTMLNIQIGDNNLTAVLEDHESANALLALLADGPLTISSENYGGFEKVCALPQSLPRNDVRTTAQPGDIMLYQGNSIVLFYGSNSWSYTKLGTIQGVSNAELRKILSGNDTTITLSVK